MPHMFRSSKTTTRRLSTLQRFRLANLVRHICLGRSVATFNIRSMPQAAGSEMESTVDGSDGGNPSRATGLGNEHQRSIVKHEVETKLSLSPAQSSHREICQVRHTVYNFLPTARCTTTLRPTSFGLFIYHWDQYKVTYSLALHLRLPDLFGRKALVVNFMLRQNAVYWLSLSCRYGTMGISNLVTCRADIWQACLAGDERTVRDLIHSRRASPYDILERCICKDPHRSHHCCWRLVSRDTILSVCGERGALRTNLTDSRQRLHLGTSA